VSFSFYLFFLDKIFSQIFGPQKYIKNQKFSRTILQMEKLSLKKFYTAQISCFLHAVFVLLQNSFPFLQYSIIFFHLPNNL